MSALRRFKEKVAGNMYWIALNGDMCTVFQDGGNVPQARARLKKLIDSLDGEFRTSPTRDTRRGQNGRLLAGYLLETKNDTPTFKIVLSEVESDSGEKQLFMTRYYVRY